MLCASRACGSSINSIHPFAEFTDLYAKCWEEYKIKDIVSITENINIKANDINTSQQGPDSNRTWIETQDQNQNRYKDLPQSDGM